MPLRSRLLAVPSLRSKYLGYVREIAERSLDWQQLQSLVAQHVKLIESEVALDTRKLFPTEAFQVATSERKPSADADQKERSLRGFFEQRREFLLKYQEPSPKAEPQD